MNRSELRREASRTLRDTSACLRAAIAEANRLLALAGDAEETEVATRRHLEHESVLNPEFFA